MFIANESQQVYGGGFSFIRNIRKAMDIEDDYTKADVILIPSASMVKPEVAEQAKRDGKKVILRVDNVLRHSRNGGKGMARMERMAKVADAIVFQSMWAKLLLGDIFLKPDCRQFVICNAVDTDIFNPKGRQEALEARYTYSRFNRDETKNWEMARYVYAGRSYDNEGKATLNIVGNFSPDLVDNNFDFYMGEKYKYWGVQPPEVIAQILRETDYFLYTYFNDACSNSLIEALCCGTEIDDEFGMLETGGATEIMHHFEMHGGIDYFGLERLAEDYKDVLEHIS